MKCLRGVEHTHRRIALLVGLVYQAAALYIFRDVLFGLGGILNGSTVISGSELVPFFNPQSQLFDQAKGDFSELTNGYEFRVRYSFLTTWVRHYKVLPFAFLFMLPAIVWSAYLITSWFIARVFTQLSRVAIYAGTAFPTALIYLITIYAKITHFYTLVLGLCLFTVSALVMLDAILFREARWRRRVVLACVTTLLNPAVHYLVLFGLFMAITVTTLALGELSKWIREGGFGRLRSLRPGQLLRRPTRGALWNRYIRLSNTITGRCVTAFALLLVIALVPYAIFVKFVALRGVGDLAQLVPGDYYFIKDASVSLIHVFSWDLAGIMDKIQFGDYLAKTPRVSNILYMVLVLSPLLVPGLRNSLFPSRPHRQLLSVMYVNVSFAIWATVGYADPSWVPTFHRSLAAMTRTLYATDSPVGDMTLTISSAIVQVLRFPHRFQLILFMLGPLLMSLPLIRAIDWAHGIVTGPSNQPGRTRAIAGTSTVIAVSIALGSVFFLPFLSNPAYREVFTSGNFQDFASPYPVDDLKEIKDELDELPKGKTVVLPPTETSKLVIDSQGNPHNFIDKFYIYYLDQPSFYYGLTGDTENKFEFFLLLRGLYYRQDWWINIARDIDLTYIVLNKQIEDNRGVGAEYLPDIETYLREQLEAQPEFVETIMENDSFVLYQLTDPREEEREILLFDTSWNSYLDAIFARLELSRCYDFRYVYNYETPTDGTPVHLLAEDPASAAIDLWLSENDEAFALPNSKIFAFNPDIVSSNYYLSPMFRLFLFFSDTKWNRNQMITPGIFGTFQGSFVGAPRQTREMFTVTAPEDGRYRVLLRGAAPGNNVEVTAPTLGLDEQHELRSPEDSLKIFSVDDVYEPDRQPIDVSAFTVEELEGRIPDDLVPVNFRYSYFDLGVVDAEAGAHQMVFDKLDENPMLIEGLALVPEDEYVDMQLPDEVQLVESLDDLDCSDTHPARYVSRNSYLDPVANGPHADLTNDQLLELFGLEELAPPSPDGLGDRFGHLAATGLLVMASFLVVRWRARIEPKEEA